MRAHFLAGFFLVLMAAGCKEPVPQPPNITELTAMLQSDDPSEQTKAAAWIVQLGPKASATTPALTAALKSPNVAVRQSAAMALGYVGSEAGGVVSALLTALEDNESSVQIAAAGSLGQLGPAASSAIPALERLSKRNKQSETKGSSCDPAADALKKIR